MLGPRPQPLGDTLGPGVTVDLGTSPPYSATAPRSVVMSLRVLRFLSEPFQFPCIRPPCSNLQVEDVVLFVRVPSNVVPAQVREASPR